MRRVLLSLGFAFLIACGGQATAERLVSSAPSIRPTAAAPATRTTTAAAATTSVASPAATPTPTPTRTIATATPPRAPSPSPAQAQPAAVAPAVNLCGAPANPWNYTFCGGTLITAPPATFCSYFACIASFASGRGYVMQCRDAAFSKSGGISGSCSSHGGNSRALYAS